MNDGAAGLWMLPAHVGTHRSTLATLQREFARIRALEHPHIARLNELGFNGRQYYVTGERLDGEPLRAVLAHLLPERLDVGEVDDIVRAIGAALVYAHKRGVAHGDVRPENVLVTMDKRFVLTNFLARRITRIPSRPPHPADDVRGLARLAAELYTGAPSTDSLRAAAHRGVPAARLNAIRAVLDSPPTRPKSSVAEFLEAAGFRFRSGGAHAKRAARPPRPARTWSVWRLVVPAAALIVVGGFILSEARVSGAWGESALLERGADALRVMTGRMTPTPARQNEVILESTPASAPEVAPTVAPPAVEPLAADAATASASHAAESAPALSLRDATLSGDDEPLDPALTEEAAAPDAPAKPEPEPAARLPARPAPVRVAAADEPALSFGAPRIAVREDHSVVALEVLRSGDTSGEASVGWWATPDTAHGEEDYADIGRQTVTFAAGATSARVLIPIVDDGRREADETFTVHLGRLRGGEPGSVMAARVTLHDDD